MSKPLTLKELKSLEVGEWVWIVNKENNKGYYAVITAKCKKVFAAISALTPDLPIHYFYDYGDKWVAYKNKEEAEGKGVAKEIFDKLKQEIVTGCEETGKGLSIYDCGWAYMSCVLWTSIREIAKNYGIELEDMDV